MNGIYIWLFDYNIFFIRLFNPYTRHFFYSKLLKTKKYIKFINVDGKADTVYAVGLEAVYHDKKWLQKTKPDKDQTGV